MKVVCRVSAQLLHIDLSANNTKVSFRCPRSLFTQYFLLLLVHIIKLHWQTFSPEPEGLRKCPSVYWCQKKKKRPMSAVLIHRATAGVSRVWLQNISAARKCHPKAQTGTLPLYPVPVYEREKQAEKLHKLNSGWKSFHLIKYQAITIQGLGRWGRPSLFAMSTQGIRHMDLVLGVRTVSGSSLEMHESTSRGLDVEPLLQFSTARIWTPSDFSPPIHNMNHEPTADVLHWSVIEYDVSLYYTTKKDVLFYLSQALHWQHRWTHPPLGTPAEPEEQERTLGPLSRHFLQR